MGAMKLRLLLVLPLVVPALAPAADGLELALKSKSMAAVSAQGISTPTPVASGKDHLPELLLRAENEERSLAAAGCRIAATDLCYDLREGRDTYGGARQYRPHIDGLKAESVSLRHDGVMLRYSFR